MQTLCDRLKTVKMLYIPASSHSFLSATLLHYAKHCLDYSRHSSTLLGNIVPRSSVRVLTKRQGHLRNRHASPP